MYTAQGAIEKSDLVESRLPMVRRIAMQMSARLPACVELDDLIQAGTMGLLEACTRYRENAGAQFDTFATQRVRGAMLDELRSRDWSPRRLRRAARDIEQAIQAAGHRTGRQPSEGEIAQQLEVSLPQYRELLRELHGCQLVYAQDHEDDDSGGDGLERAANGASRERAASDDPMALLLSAEFRSRLVGAIAALPEREAQLMSLYYDEELNLREIGAVLEVTESRASQLHSQAIGRLRVMLKELVE